ncbi:hypothetical protein PQX77_001136 [Marasmius sp. AFHP31]|nr:hypothetical protein PQX77_001136 [Marasmius sp. AFHP31]
MFIWTQVREACGVPEPWESMTEVEWARLLFGSTTCQSCGTRGVQRVDFILLKRMCLSCIQTNGLTKRQFKTIYPDEDIEVLDLVEKTRAGRTSHKEYYDKEEIERVLLFTSLCKNRTELEDYMEERQEYLGRLEAHARMCYRWVVDGRYQRLEDIHTVRKERLAAISSRLREMGYTDEDIAPIRMETEVYKAKPLTERSWRVLKNELPAAIWDHRGLRRLARLQAGKLPSSIATIVTSRCSLISQRYFSYKRTLAPLEWRSKMLPSVETTWCLPSMRKLIGLPEDIEVTPEMVRSAITDEDYVEEIGNIADGFQEKLVIYNSQNAANRDRVFSRNIKSTHKRPNFEPRAILGDPATLQLMCWTCETVCSSSVDYLCHLTGSCLLTRQARGFWEELSDWKVTTFHSYSASGLVRASLGEGRMYDASGDEMDDRGDWYRCLGCAGTDDEDGCEEFIGTWRECIIHGIEEGQVNPYTRAIMETERHYPSFQILHSVDALELKDERKCWSCAHCTISAEEPWTREDVVAHLRDAHDRSDARVPDDFFYAPWGQNGTM